MSDTPGNPHSESPPEIITARSYIAALLQRTVSERLLVSVKFSAEQLDPVTSTVLQVLPHEGQLLFDEFFPQPSAQALTAGSTISVAVRFEGASLQFSAVIDSLQEEGGLRLWRVVFPESVKYWQARSEHRVVVTALAIPVRLYVGEGVVLKGQLQDLCTQGVGLRLAKMAGLKRGKAYRCSIDHSDDESVEIEIEPSRATKVAGALPVLLGAHLHNMSRHDMGQWQRFVAEIERRLLRKH